MKKRRVFCLYFILSHFLRLVVVTIELVSDLSNLGLPKNTNYRRKFLRASDISRRRVRIILSFFFVVEIKGGKRPKVYTSLNVVGVKRARVNVRKRRSMEETLGAKIQRRNFSTTLLRKLKF